MENNKRKTELQELAVFIETHKGNVQNFDKLREMLFDAYNHEQSRATQEKIGNLEMYLKNTINKEVRVFLQARSERKPLKGYFDDFCQNFLADVKDAIAAC